jgi:hypothetical protein
VGLYFISWFFLMARFSITSLSPIVFLSSSDKEMFKRTHKQDQLVFAVSMVGANTLEFFNTNELELSVGQSVD